MFKKLLTRIFTKPSPEATQAPASRPDSPAPADDSRGGRRQRPRRPAGDRPGDPPRQQQQATQERPKTEDGEAPKKRRRRRRKPASARSENATQAGERSELAPVRPRPNAGRSEPERAEPARSEDDDQRSPVHSRERKSAVDATTGPQPRTAYFGKLRVSPPVARALEDMGYTEPTPIQEEVIAPMCWVVAVF